MQTKSGAYWPSRRSLLLRYGVAVASVAMATGLKLLLEPLLPQQSPFLLLAGAVMVAAWFGGLGPGLVATVLGALSADFFYLAPVGSLTGLAGGGFWLQVLFVLQGALITSLAQALHLSRQRAEKSTLEIQRHQEKLAERERQLQSLVGRMIEAQEEERRRVAYEVHDGFTQMAAAAYRRLTLLAEHHPPEDAQELAQEQHKRTEEGAPRGEPLPHRRESGTTVAYQRRTTTTIAILEAPVPPSEAEG